MQAQWEKLGYTPEIRGRHHHPSPLHTISTTRGIGITAIVILGYYAFVLWASKKEYREVIREKFE